MWINPSRQYISDLPAAVYRLPPLLTLHSHFNCGFSAGHFVFTQQHLAVARFVKWCHVSHLAARLHHFNYIREQGRMKVCSGARRRILNQENIWR